MRPIGGELEKKMSPYNHYFTDSGRSSLRLFLRSSDFKEKKYLIPNFFCNIIEEVLKEEGVEYDFYNTMDTLRIDTDSISSKTYDVLYIINYFGMIQELDTIDISSKIIIEDNVFFTDFRNTGKYKFWYAFNSFRKITKLSDGSLIKTNLDIDNNIILPDEAPFVKEKTIAKEIKYNYINNQIGAEDEYISKFEKAEETLNKQKSIFRISNKSLFLLFKISQDNQTEKKRYLKLKKIFSLYSFNHHVEYYSFFMIKLQNRDKLKQYLIKREVYLPIHWPESSQKNSLYSEVISIPLFAQYKEEEFNHMIDSIEEFLDG